MGRERLKSVGLGVYRAGLLAGIGVIIWLQTHFVTKERWQDGNDYRDRIVRETVAGINVRLDRIERKLDRL